MSDDTTSGILASAKQAISEQRYDDAIAELTNLIRSTPDDPDVLATLGAAHAQSKNYPQAMAYLSKALSIQPSARGHYNLAALLVIQGKKAEAADHLKAALDLDPTYDRAQQMLTQVSPAPDPVQAPVPTPVAAAPSPDPSAQPVRRFQ